MNYELLAMDTAWRRFERSHGNAQSIQENRIRAFEMACPAVNLAPETVQIATEIAAFQADLDTDDRTALIVLVLVSLAALQQGSTQFPVIGPQARLPMLRMVGALCGSPGDGLVEQVIERIDKLITQRRASAVIGYQGTDYKPLLFASPHIINHRISHAERQLAAIFAAMLRSRAAAQFSETQIRAALDKVLARPMRIGGVTGSLSAEQREALVAVARRGLTLISGGPGTGKTSIVLAIMRLMVRLGIQPSQIVLAAPTGKAAYRMGESIREALGIEAERDEIDRAIADAHVDPATIHRLLGYSPETNRFRHHRNNQLAAKVVIIDECSMLDLTLMERLAGAVESDARLILLGDADQLPSVSAGSVFRDLVAPIGSARAALTDASIRLQENHRMKQEDAGGRSVLRAAISINQGDVGLLNAVEQSADRVASRRASPTELAFEGFEFLAALPTELGTFLDHWYEKRLRGDADIESFVADQYVQRDAGFDGEDCARLRRLFAHAAKSRILCVTRVFDTGATRINARFHARAAADARVAGERVEYVVGEPLIVLRNDYQRGLFNGDQGIRLWVRRGNRAQVPMAVFPRGDNFVAFHFDALREHLELGYAMTVHKAQGSEFDSVVIVLPEKSIPILTRELIYTAVSRARKSVIVVGDEARLAEAIAAPVERFSGLTAQIDAALSR
ncbi:MAG: exodeoxyribonuclease V subunit alpha [Candidatus Binatus sp.]|uniref:exodeoxyribonuclease V subunit alpha n=1 Tax=Candidatus Binatus sp. TaxID=2811406 RepID=UPI0027215B5F|nr:exodeoxyribonuclease V subunit alpha [Candidatus Binatus sp.]MDO8431517.1 exodeoxyribonuclease V subunit alpha [Candidatus Binatus sp.]